MSTAVEITKPGMIVDVEVSRRRLRWLLAWIVVLLLSIESSTRLLHNHRKITMKMEESIGDAVTIRGGSGRMQILLVGNSLIYEGVSRQTIQQSMGATYKVVTAGIPGSTYQDWRYGLRALFERGSQPEVVVFGISPSQFLRPSSVTALPVSRLWRVQEIAAYYRAEDPGLSTLGELLLEHISSFFYMRDTMRIYVRKSIPGYESMANRWARSTLQPSIGMANQRTLEMAFAAKLVSLQSECRSHARLIVLIVPTDQPEDEALEAALRAAAVQTGIAIVAPIHEREWPANKFQPDGYHLTPPAAIEFSRLAGAELASVLSKPDEPQR